MLFLLWYELYSLEQTHLQRKFIKTKTNYSWDEVLIDVGQPSVLISKVPALQLQIHKVTLKVNCREIFEILKSGNFSASGA